MQFSINDGCKKFYITHAKFLGAVTNITIIGVSLAGCDRRKYDKTLGYFNMARIAV